ncbi:MAG: peroxidase [Planctomycetota bacterium]
MAQEGDADALVHALVRDWRSAALRAPDRALCAFAVKLTRDQRSMSPADLDLLRAHGFDDTAIHDATQVVAYFNYITRIADALGVEPETFIQTWGIPPARSASSREAL